MGDRIYLTRHADLIGRGVIYIGEDRVFDQLRVMNRFISLRRAADPLSRCVECNAQLVDVGRQDVKGEVPEHIYITYERFTRCPSCKRLYWPGTHVDHMREKIEEILT